MTMRDEDFAATAAMIKKIKIGAVAVAAGITALTLIMGSVYTINETDRGVILRNGKAIGMATPGLNFKIPFIDSVQRMSVQTGTMIYDKVETYSRDQQTANLRISVTYRLLPEQVVAMYSEFQTTENYLGRVVERQVLENAKNTFGKFNAVTAIQDRPRLAAEISSAIKSALKGPIKIESIQLENIDFSKTYEQSIEQRMLAEVEVQKVQQNAEREKVQAEIKVIQAKAEADASLAQARANAEAIELKGRAEAKAIDLRGKALAANPNLVDLVTAERWDGTLPTTMVPGSTVPFLNLKK